jgi:hypothetical protein
MAIDIKLDRYGALDLSTGDLQLIEDSEEVAQIVKTKILKLYDEDLLALETGTDWFGLLFVFTNDNRYRSIVLKAIILAIPEVKDIPLIEMYTDTITEKCVLNIQINDIYSDVPLQIGG